MWRKLFFHLNNFKGEKREKRKVLRAQLIFEIFSLYFGNNNEKIQIHRLFTISRWNSTDGLKIMLRLLWSLSKLIYLMDSKGFHIPHSNKSFPHVTLTDVKKNQSKVQILPTNNTITLHMSILSLPDFYCTTFDSQFRGALYSFHNGAIWSILLVIQKKRKTI